MKTDNLMLNQVLCQSVSQSVFMSALCKTAKYNIYTKQLGECYVKNFQISFKGRSTVSVFVVICSRGGDHRQKMQYF